jgi:hypothetical protein
MTRLGRVALIFLVIFVGAVILLGDLFGSFPDSDQRIRDIVAWYLLALAGLAFAWFARQLANQAERHAEALRLTGYAAAGGMVLSAVAAASTPMSAWFGALFGDPGIQEGQGVLPQFAWVAFAMGALLPAGIFIISAARSSGLLPR